MSAYCLLTWPFSNLSNKSFSCDKAPLVFSTSKISFVCLSTYRKKKWRFCYYSISFHLVAPKKLVRVHYLVERGGSKTLIANKTLLSMLNQLISNTRFITLDFTDHEAYVANSLQIVTMFTIHSRISDNFHMQ